jgi:hypothetical protein
MNTFTDLPASPKCPRNNRGDYVMDAMMGLQQSFAGALMPVA